MIYIFHLVFRTEAKRAKGGRRRRLAPSTRSPLPRIALSAGLEFVLSRRICHRRESALHSEVRRRAGRGKNAQRRKQKKKLLTVPFVYLLQRRLRSSRLSRLEALSVNDQEEE